MSSFLTLTSNHLLVAGDHVHGDKHFCDMGYCNQPNAHSCDANTQQCVCNPGYAGTFCENAFCELLKCFAKFSQ